MKRPSANFLRLALLVGALAVLAPLPAGATVSRSSAIPCWKRLLNDWYDGTINNVYPIPCYSDAIKHLPPESEIYGSAREDILAARQAAINKQPAPPEKSGSTSTSSGATTGSTSTSSGATTGTSASTSTSETPPQTTTTTTTETTNGTTTTTAVVVVVPTSTTPKKKGGISGALADITPGDPQAFPLPLLILGALAIALVIAGIIGMLWQRSHPREEPPPA